MSTPPPHPSPVIPAVVPGDRTAEVHYQQHDLLRRIMDLLVNDWIAFDGQVRQVEAVRLNRRQPGESLLRLVDDPIDEATGRPVFRTYGSEIKVRVLRSNWEAPPE